MGVHSPPCDSRRIASFLDGQLTESEQATLEEHLSECSACRMSLDAQTADEDMWEKAGRYLHDDGDHTEPFHGLHELNESSVDCDVTHSVQHVLDALGPTDDPQMLGRIGGYEVSGVVGFGGMGVVLKAVDKSLDRTVAIKVMAPHLASNGTARKRFAREAKAAAAVLHPNVMAIHSVSTGETLPFLVMPYMRGTSLQKRLDVEGPLPVGEILRIASQTAAGLAAAHGQGLVHRDIKPANILLEEGVERVAITDFGLARAVDDADMTRTGVVAGTPQYMSPEQARGDSVDQRSDLFSLGSVMYAMCTGRPPFRAESSYGVLRRITDDEPQRIRDLNPDIPEWLCAVITKLMAKQAANRFQSAAEVAELLEDCLAHQQQPLTVPLPTLAVSFVANRGRRPPLLPILVAAAFAFSLILAGILIVVELNKGKLTIQCESDDIPIRIMQGDKVVEQLTVSKSGKTIRIAAGRYQVEIDADFDGITVEGGEVSLKRGGRETVKIVRSTDTSDTDKGASTDKGAREDAVTIEAPKDVPGVIILRGRKDEVTAVADAIRTSDKGAGPAEPSKDVEPSAVRIPDAVALVMLMHPAELEDGNGVQQSAASVALGQLSWKDYCGILTFPKETPQTPAWLWGDARGVVKIGERRAELLKSIAGSNTGDFPQFDPALRMALKALSQVDAKRRHMIVLTNGDPDVTDDGILKAFREAGITISVVHIELHGPRYEATPKRIAEMTGGRYYHVQNAQPSVVETIFRSEATRLTQNSAGETSKGRGADRGTGQGIIRVTRVYPIGNLPIWTQDGKKQGAGLLIRYLKSHVYPPSWDSRTTVAAYDSDQLSLVVQAPVNVHNEVASTLDNWIPKLATVDETPQQYRVSHPVGDLPLWTRNGKAQDVDLLIHYLKSVVGATSWDERGVQAWWLRANNSLVVQANDAIQSRVRDAINVLRVEAVLEQLAAFVRDRDYAGYVDLLTDEELARLARRMSTTEAVPEDPRQFVIDKFAASKAPRETKSSPTWTVVVEGDHAVATETTDVQTPTHIEFTHVNGQWKISNLFSTRAAGDVLSTDIFGSADKRQPPEPIGLKPARRLEICEARDLSAEEAATLAKTEGSREILYLHAGDNQIVPLRRMPEALLNETDLVSAVAIADPDIEGAYSIDLKLTAEATERFARETRRLARQAPPVRLAILVPGNILAAPRLRSEIPDGNLRITGQFTKQEAERLAADLNRTPDSTRRADETHSSNRQGIRVHVLLNRESYSREMMQRNLGFDRISLYGAGMRGVVDGKETTNFVGVLAHECVLESFEETDDPGGKFWDTTFFIPQTQASDGSNRSLTQKSLDQLKVQGVVFQLDHYREQNGE